jgi:hypothetical protein
MLVLAWLLADPGAWGRGTLLRFGVGDDRDAAAAPGMAAQSRGPAGADDSPAEALGESNSNDGTTQTARAMLKGGPARRCAP